MTLSMRPSLLVYRPRIMPSRALAYSPEDLFRHAHNR
ncbi:hypothetical protein ALC60_02545 [Trachymyrmex zeteki]|uniref:Uncharacterized protein n=1 Tax=Mycetomoellerius zeteki TaxID=64791 RepID=A0A151XDS2_9HYME|nr:hypothetical protein ALC60_02545 [Trachymyrmex zeteki]